MSELIDFTKRRERKQVEKTVNQLTRGSKDESLNAYIEMMSKLVHSNPPATGKIYVDCISQDRGVLKDEDGLILHYRDMFGSTEELENHDLLLSGLISLSPKEIVILNYHKLNEQLLEVITSIFKDRVELNEEK